MKFWVSFFTLTLLVTSCATGKVPSSEGTKESSEIKSLLEKHVSSGTKADELAQFFREQNWQPTFDKYERAFMELFNYGGRYRHKVRVKIWVREDGSVERAAATDVYTGLYWLIEICFQAEKWTVAVLYFVIGLGMRG